MQHQTLVVHLIRFAGAALTATGNFVTQRYNVEKSSRTRRTWFDEVDFDTVLVIELSLIHISEPTRRS